MGQSKIEFSLIIPTFNERDNILLLLNQVEQALNGVSFEVLVVDDNSPDKTGDAVLEYSKSHPNVKLVLRLKPAGLSAAVIDGLDRAKGRFLGVMDADLSHDTALLLPLLKAVRAGHLMAVGSRKVKGGGAENWPWFRRAFSGLATFLAYLWLNSPLKDPMSGYFVMDRKIFEKVRKSLDPKGYKILLEIIARAQIIDVIELPYIFTDRKWGVSKLSSSVAQQYLAMLWDLRSFSRPYRWVAKISPDKDSR